MSDFGDDSKTDGCYDGTGTRNKGTRRRFSATHYSRVEERSSDLSDFSIEERVEERHSGLRRMADFVADVERCGYEIPWSFGDDLVCTMRDCR